MPRKPSEFDMIEHHLQQVARIIRDSQPGGLALEQLRNKIYGHVFEALEICVHLAYSDRNTSPSATTHPVHPSPAHPGGGGRGGALPGADDLSDDLDLLK